jgi:protein TonB
MEQEALRVLRKAAKKKWIPAVQNGRPVKAYRSQPITFEVLGT